MKKCKICESKLLKRQKSYCSNKCKFSDENYNKSRSTRPSNENGRIVVCKLCAYSSKDSKNLSGSLSKHLKYRHNLDLSKTQVFSYFSEKLIDIKYLNCPVCDWKTTDFNNDAGALTKHISKSHDLSIDKFVEMFPNYKTYWKIHFVKKEREEFLKKSEHNRIKCEICEKWFKKLSNTHLKKHGISPTDYKKKYDVSTIVSKSTIIKQSDLYKNETIRQEMSEKVKNSNLRKYGANSYTQTIEGKKKIRKSLFETMYNRYINSSKINEHVEILFSLSDYRGVKDERYPFRCKKCKSEFLGSLENGRIPRCLECYPLINGWSNAEKEIVEYVKTLTNSELIENDRKILGGLELDIYNPHLNIAIEYNGFYTHSEINGGKDKTYHLNKTEQCEKQGIHLIHIFEDEWINKKEIVKSRLKIIYGKCDDIIYARNCNIKEIGVSEKDDFLYEHHIQGTDRSKIKIGAYCENKLVAVMTFRKFNKSSNINMLDGEYELSRFCSNGIVVGIASKMLKFFISKYSPEKIISYADRRWSFSSNNLYTILGFDLVSISSPSHWYFSPKDKKYIRKHRYNFRKGVLKNKLDTFDSNLTEFQNMELNGYDRIWDCGSLRYEMNFK